MTSARYAADDARTAANACKTIAKRLDDEDGRPLPYYSPVAVLYYDAADALADIAEHASIESDCKDAGLPPGESRITLLRTAGSARDMAVQLRERAEELEARAAKGAAA